MVLTLAIHPDAAARMDMLADLHRRRGQPDDHDTRQFDKSDLEVTKKKSEQRENTAARARRE